MRLKTRKVRYPADCERIQQVLKGCGVEVSLYECEKIWMERSENFDAGWLSLPYSDLDLLVELSPYIEVDE